MSNNVGSINDSRINVKKCASRNGLKLRSANTARSMRCNTAVQDHGRRLNQSHFRSMAEVSFLPSANTRKRDSASREGKLYFVDVINLKRTWSCMVEVIVSMEICCKFYNYKTAMHLQFALRNLSFWCTFYTIATLV